MVDSIALIAYGVDFLFYFCPCPFFFFFFLFLLEIVGAYGFGFFFSWTPIVWFLPASTVPCWLGYQIMSQLFFGRVDGKPGELGLPKVIRGEAGGGFVKVVL